ncbi:MAG: NnrS family protein, partial [Deltaproteobacteria bacterium]|nr:NnrS family protein [Deltaproteobacteria bacterium]
MTPTRWQVFSSAPHRMFFWGAMAVSLLSMALWSLHLAEESLPPEWGLPAWAGLEWTLPPRPAHGVLMVFGMLGAAFLGFLLTTFPRWLVSEPVARRHYIAIWFFHTGGGLVWVAGMVARPAAAQPWLGMLGAAGMGIGYALALVRLGRVKALATNQDPQTHHHAQFVMTAFGMGLVGLGLAVAGCLAWGLGGLGFDTYPLGLAAFQFSLALGVYPFAFLMVLTVAHRMVPFFTSTVVAGYDIRRGGALLWMGAPILALRAAVMWLGHPQITWITDLPLLVLLLRELVLWRFWQVPPIPLLRVLYWALAWMGISLVLSITESLMVITQAGFIPAAAPFGNAALHALTVGGFGTMMLGMFTRVTLGHSGLGITSAGWMESMLFRGFQLVVLWRVGTEVLAGLGYSTAGLLWISG